MGKTCICIKSIINLDVHSVAKVVHMLRYDDKFQNKSLFFSTMDDSNLIKFCMQERNELTSWIQ